MKPSQDSGGTRPLFVLFLPPLRSLTPDSARGPFVAALCRNEYLFAARSIDYRTWFQ